MAEERQQHQHQTTALSWGTLEELLLACAVNRHGTESWDSIAMEVQNRTSSLSSLTSQHCRDKFNDLKHRFMIQPVNDDTSSATASASLIPMIDELRSIRVEELRREVKRRDVSIVSLELKVKRLEEERDRSLKEEADLMREDKLSSEKIACKSAAGDHSEDEHDNRSFNESNSTGQQKADAATTKAREQNDTVVEETDIKTEPEIKNEQDPIRDRSDLGTERDWSHNGKLEEVVDYVDVDKLPDKKRPEIKMSQTTGGLGESNELGESVGESKREEKEKEKQQNSDVQSSASLSLKSKKKWRRFGVAVGNSSGEEPEGGDEVSPATKRTLTVKSEPLVKLLGTIRSHRLGSVFERRLRTQESERYKKLIRQHMDLQIIQSRLDKGVYSACFQKFFRDLLLLFSNAIIFFRKSLPESLAASELRAIVLKELKEKLRKPKPESAVMVKPDSKQQPISLSKPNKTSSTIVACGKGSSGKTKSENATKKVSKKDRVVEEKSKGNEKKGEGSVVRMVEDKGIRKKRTKERSVSSNSSRNPNSSNKIGELKHQYGGNELSSHDGFEMKVERKGNSGSSTRKRQGAAAASFLKRMKQNSPSEITEDDEDDNDNGNDNDNDSFEEESKDRKGKDEKGGRRGRSGKNRNEITRRVTRSSRGRTAREESGRAKRITGRSASKKQPESSTVESGGGGTKKRGRDNNNNNNNNSGGFDGVGGGRRARKRSRR